MEKLPEDMKLEILLRLPIKSLACLMCVSKLWFSIINNPNFAELHLRLSNYSQHPNRILLTTAPQMRSIDINASLHNDSNTINLNLPPLKPYTDIRIIDSCRGILLIQVEYNHLFMWNPVTGECQKISLPHEWKIVTLFAFCYHESIDDYFIGLSYYPDHKSRSLQLFEVLSLRANSSEKIDINDHYSNIFQFRNRGTIFNGAIHFIAYTCRSYPSKPEVISYDITTKDLRTLPPPIAKDLECPDLGVHKGCLTLTGATCGEIVLWAMREYGVKSSWTKLFSLPHYQSSIGYFQPLLFVREGDEFVTSYLTKNGDEGISKWNDRGEMLEHCTYGPNLLPWRPPYMQYWSRAIVYTETLLPLP